MAQNQSILVELMLIRIRHLMELTKLSRATIYNKMNINSPYYDPAFPTSIRIGVSAVAWRLCEVQAWIESRT